PDDVQGINAVYPSGAGHVSLSITTSELPPAPMGADYSATLEANGGTGGYHWTLTSGQVPAGLQIGMSGLLYGRTNASGSFVFTTQVVDSSGTSSQRSFTLAVTPAGTAPIVVSAEYRKKKVLVSGQNFQVNAA